MNKSNVCALLIVLALNSCSEPIQRYAVKEDVTLRMRAGEDCGYCKSVRYSPNGQQTAQIKIGPVIARSGDIKYVERTGSDPAIIRFAYFPSAESRIREVTTDNIGSIAVVMSGDNAVSLSEISEPFSKGSTIDGIPLAEAEYLISNVASGPYLESQ